MECDAVPCLNLFEFFLKCKLKGKKRKRKKSNKQKHSLPIAGPAAEFEIFA